MAIADLTITNEELEGKKISDIVGDTLVGTPAENKQKFDDYSDVLKEKFNELIDELVNLSPQNNVLEGVQVNGIDLTVSGKKVNITLTTQSNDGAMSIADKTKLDGLNKTSSVTSGGAGIPTSGAVYSAIQDVAGIASDTADFVVSYDNWVEASDGTVWKVRKWDSGLCEAWLDDYGASFGATAYYELANGMCIMGATNATDFSLDGFRYPSGLFTGSEAPTARFYISHAESVYARLSYICPRSTLSSTQMFKSTSAMQIVCARKPSDTTEYNYAISVYATGWWK
jgi:hypothetical protein